MKNWDIKHFMGMCSSFNTDYKSSEPLKTLLLCYVKAQGFVGVTKKYLPCQSAST